MAERIYAALTTGNTYYAKPAPIVDDPWGTDVETMSEDGTVSGWFYTAEIADPDDVYVIFEQAGGSPADTDTLVGPVEMAAGTLTALGNGSWATEAGGTGDQFTALNNLSAADVNAQVLDVIATDTLIDGKTLQEAVRYIAAVLAGKLSGAGTGTEAVKGLDGSTDRVTFTVDGSGNRTAVSYDP